MKKRLRTYEDSARRGHAYVRFPVVSHNSTDSCEREADRIANSFNERGPSFAIRTMPSIYGTTSAAVVSAIQSPGRPLDNPFRKVMESHLGHNFGHVRVHTDDRASASARALNARAYTIGQDIVFRPEHYAPQTAEGRGLIAHELTHVVQQVHATPTIQRAPDKSADGGRMPATAGESGQRDANVVDTAHIISSRTKTNAKTFINQIEAACEALKSYAEPKLKDMATQVIAGDLASALAGSILGVLGMELKGKVGSEILQSAADAIDRELRATMAETIKKADFNKNDISSLREAIGVMAKAAKDYAGKVEDIVGRTLDPKLNSIVAKVSTGQTLSADENDLLTQFDSASPQIIDSNLSGAGIPDAANGKRIQLDVYAGLVEKLEEKIIWARAGIKDNLTMTGSEQPGSEDSSLIQKAQQRAAEARNQREKELQKLAK